MNFANIFLLPFALTFLLVSTQTFAQDAPGTQPSALMQASQPPANTPAVKSNGMIDRLSDILNLTDDQNAQLVPIFTDAQKKGVAIFQDKTLTNDQKHDQLAALRVTVTAQIRAVLTTNQQIRFDDLVAEMNAAAALQGDGSGSSDQITSILNLTPAQEGSWNAIIAQSRKTGMAIFQNSALTDDQKQAQFEKIEKSIQAQLRKLLTPNQQIKFDDIVAKDTGQDDDEDQSDAGDPVSRLNSALKLTTDQEPQWNAIIRSSRRQQLQINSNTKLSADQKQKQVTQIRADVSSQLRAMLTPNQQILFDQFVYDYQSSQK